MSHKARTDLCRLTPFQRRVLGAIDAGMGSVETIEAYLPRTTKGADVRRARGVLVRQGLIIVSLSGTITLTAKGKRSLYSVASGEPSGAECKSLRSASAAAGRLAVRHGR